MKTIDEWTAHWNGKSDIDDPVILNGYCVDGVPISRERYFEAVIDPLLARLELEPHHRVLDIGCGSGLTLGEIEKRVAVAIGTDFSMAMLQKYKGKAKTYVCSAHEVPFEGEQFDRILMYSVAIYFPNFEYFRQVTEKCLSILRCGGIFLIGDLLLGSKPENSQYQWFDRHALVEYFDSLGFPYSIAAQSRRKRSINKRFDVILYKD